MTPTTVEKHRISQAICRVLDTGQDQRLFQLEDGSWTIQEDGTAWPIGVVKSRKFYASDPESNEPWRYGEVRGV